MPENLFKNVILHIGLHKTATTFFQERVWPNLKTYTFLTRPFTQHNHAFNRLQYADDTLYDKDSVIRELKNIRTDNLIISDENLTGKPVLFAYINRSLIAARLKSIFPEAKILLFLRDQKDILRSYYSSYIKMLYGTKKFRDFIWRPGKDFTIEDYKQHPEQYDLKTLYFNTNDFYLHLDCFKYVPLIECYKSLFADVHVFLYEEFVHNSREALDRIGTLVGERLEIPEQDKVNVSLSADHLEKTRQANILAAHTSNRPLKRILQIGMRLLSGTRQESEKSASELVGDYYRQDNARLKSILPELQWDKFPDKYC